MATSRLLSMAQFVTHTILHAVALGAFMGIGERSCESALSTGSTGARAGAAAINCLFIHGTRFGVEPICHALRVARAARGD